MTRTPSSGGEIPLEVRRFLEQRIASVEEFEILLLLYYAPTQYLSAESVGESLRIPERTTASLLEELGRQHLLDVRIGADVCYRYNPATPELAATVQQTVEAYKEDRTAILALLTARRRRALRDFSAAFRLTKDGRDG
jgi:hypothetical protein